MISSVPQSVWAIVSQIAAAAADLEPSRAQNTFLKIDQLFFAVALVLVVAVIARMALWPGRDPLRAAPARPNALGLEALALAVLVYLVSAMVLAGIVQAVGGDTRSVVATLVVGTGAHAAGIGACLFIASGQFEGGIRRFWCAEGGARLGRSSATIVLVTIAAVGLCPSVRDATTSVILHFAPNHEFAAHPTIRALRESGLPARYALALWISAVAVAPIAEELFFRGLLQTFLLRLVRRRWIAISLASLAFGAVHLQQPHAIAALAVLGLLIGYAYERTGSLLPPILIHALFNLNTLIGDALAASHPH
jgi:membrane protease YdiL (CAAX protease family)